MERLIPKDLSLYDTVYGNDFPDSQYYVILFDNIPSKKTNANSYDLSIIDQLKSDGYIEHGKIENERKHYKKYRKSLFVNYENKIIVIIESDEDKKNTHVSLEILYDLSKGEITKQLDIDKYETYKIIKKKSNISLIKSEHGHLDTEEFDLNVPDIDLKLNYGENFLKTHEIIIKNLNKDKHSGIILLHGDPGTGKTSYIKYITKLVENKEILFIPPSMAECLSDPSIIPFLMEKTNTVLVVEDGEKVITDRETSGSSIGVSNILNLTDGILGDCLSITIIVTFNMERKKIDEALLRKGRLIAEHKFEKLNVNETNKLLSYLGKNITSEKGLTLADIYNIDGDDVRVTKDKNKKIGF